MMKVFVLAPICLGPLAATAQQAWGDEGGCARALGQQVLTDMVFVLWPDRIERHESSCRIIDLQGDLNTRAVIDTECLGEGETWAQSYGITPHGPDIFMIWPADAPDYVTELRVCE